MPSIKTTSGRVADGVMSYSHNDMDGKAASYFIHKLLDKIEIPNYTGNFSNMTYDDHFDQHKPGDLVFITDLSFTELTYPRLLTVCKTARAVFWLDHHTSSVQVVKKHEAELKAQKNLIYWVDSDFCGAMLAYGLYKLVDGYNELMDLIHAESVILDMRKINDGFNTYEADSFISNSDDPETMEPHLHWSAQIDPNSAIRLIDDHDRWTKQNEENTTHFKLGLDVENTAFVTYQPKISQLVFNPIYGHIFDEGAGGRMAVKGYIEHGRVIRKYLHARYARELRAAHGEYYLPGYGTFIVMNNLGNSWCFDDLYNAYTGSILWSFNEQKQLYTYSMYVPEVHQDMVPANMIAEMLGGGGHKGAAGWSSKWQMFKSNQSGVAYRDQEIEDVKFRIFYGEEFTPDLMQMTNELYAGCIRFMSEDIDYPDLTYVDMNSGVMMLSKDIPVDVIINTQETFMDRMEFTHNPDEHPQIVIHPDLRDDRTIDVVICTTQNFKERMELFHYNVVGVSNPFPIILKPDLNTPSEIADFIANALCSIIDDFIIN